MGRPNNQLKVSDFGAHALRFVEAEDPKDRKTAADPMLEAIAAVRTTLARSRLASPRLTRLDELRDRIRALADSGSKRERATMAVEATQTYERLIEAATSIDTHRMPGHQWRPSIEPLTPEDKDTRLRRTHAATKGTARTLAEAIRKVVSSRHREGVGLHETFVTEAHAAYAMAASDHRMGLVPTVISSPPTSKQTGPWGVFRVRSAVTPAEAAERFAASPPLPSRGELLEANFSRLRFASLHPNAPRPDAAPRSEATDDA